MTVKMKYTVGRIMTTYIPILCSVIILLHCIFNFYGSDPYIFSYLGGTSILVWIYFLWNSYLFGLCIYQKMFIYYLIFSNLLAIIDIYIGIPLSDINYLLVYCISFGITILLYGYFKFRENKSKQLEL